ncbi:M48 family metallopeptidase [Rickettsiales bacterium]|nr:M48 family metallopeptidase [Rickettsiales bacterium]
MKNIIIKIHNQEIQIICKKSNKAKKIRISINYNKEISLIIPRSISYKIAYDFLLSKSKWVEKALIKIDKKNQNKINFSQEKNIYLTQDQIEKYSKTIIDRTLLLAKKYNFSNLQMVKIKSQKTLWGSCSSKNNINLNINLIKLDQELIDYVILHELTHLNIKNHSKKFWQELEKLEPKARILDKKLKNYNF